MGNLPKITLRGFKPNARGAGHVLGKLQTAVMELLWSELRGLSVNEVEDCLQCRRVIAYAVSMQIRHSLRDNCSFKAAMAHTF